MRIIYRKLIPIVLFILLWQLVVVSVAQVRQVSFPSPLETVVTLWQLLAGRTLAEHALSEHVLASLYRWLVGFSIAALSGIGYGLLAGWSKRFEQATYLIVLILQMIPGLAWIPVAILCFGIGEAATVFMIAVTAFTPIAINVLNGTCCPAA